MSAIGEFEKLVVTFNSPHANIVTFVRKIVALLPRLRAEVHEREQKAFVAGVSRCVDLMDTAREDGVLIAVPAAAREFTEENHGKAK